MGFKSISGAKRVIISAIFLSFAPVFISSAFAATDTDGDGVNDSSDNCIQVHNPLQRDTDADGFGNVCDADLNGDLTVDLTDFSLFRIVFATTDPDADFNGSGSVDLTDFSLFRVMFASPPGPSYIDLPPIPLNVMATADDTQVTISWDSVAGATSYNIYWNTTGNVTMSDAQITTASSPYIHTGLINGTTYYYVVTAVNAAGESAESLEVNVTPPPSRKLDISFFGEGAVSIVGNLNSITCTRVRNCYGEFNDGETVTISAESSQGWDFESWQYCDSVIGKECTVVMSRDRLVDATFHSIEPLVVRSDVIELSSAQIQDIQDYSPTSGVIIFKPSVDMTGIVVGNILISKGIWIAEADPGNIEIYFARRVNKVTNSSSGIIVETGFVSLSEIIESGHVSYEEVSIIANPIASVPQAAQFAKLTQPQNLKHIDVDFIVYDEDDDHATPNDQIKVNGTIDLDTSVDFDLYKRPFSFDIQSFRFLFESYISNNLSLVVTKNFDIIKEKVPLYKFPVSAPIIIGPILMQHELSVLISVEVSAEGEMSVTASLEGSSIVGYSWHKDDGFTYMREFNMDPNLGAYAEVVAKEQVGPELHNLLRFYGVAGPYIGVEGYVGLKAFAVEPSSPGCLIDFAAYWGVRANAGGELKFLSLKPIQTNAELLTYESIFGDFGKEECKEDSINPSSPTDIKAIATSTTEIELTWVEALDNRTVTNYEIFRDHKLIASNITGLRFIDRGLKQETEYCYELIALDSAGNMSLLSVIECVYTKAQDVVLPSVPSGISASALTSQSIQINWAAATDNDAVDGYVIYNTDNPSVPKAISNTQDLTFVVSELVNNSNYCFAVASIDSSGNESGLSISTCASTLQEIDLPNTPVVQTVPGDGSVTINWAPVSGAIYYNLYFASEAGVSPLNYSSLQNGLSLSYVNSPQTISGLANSATYYFVMTAVNSAGEGAGSNEVSETPSSTITIPSAPTNVQSTPGDGSATISWSGVTGATSYNLYWATQTGVTPLNYSSLQGGSILSNVTSPQAISGLINGTTYYFVITAVNADGESSGSSEVSAKPTSTVAIPSAPTNVVASADDGSVSVSWSSVSEATSYNLYWAMETGVTSSNYSGLLGGSTISNVTSPQVITGLNNGTTYYLVVTAVNSAGESSESIETSVTPASVATGPFDGNYGLAATSTTQTDVNGLPCTDALGIMNIIDSEISGYVIDGWQDTYDISGNVQSNGVVTGGFAAGGMNTATFEGSFNGENASGTWVDIVQCSGTWQGIKN